LRISFSSGESKFITRREEKVTVYTCVIGTIDKNSLNYMMVGSSFLGYHTAIGLECLYSLIILIVCWYQAPFLATGIQLTLQISL